MSRTVVAALLFAFLAAVGLGAVTAAGRSGAAIGPATLQVLAPTVDVARGAAGFAAALDGQSIAAGDRVRTGPQGHAVITFFEGSTLELVAGTEVRIDSAAVHDGITDIGIAQAIGRTVSAVHKLVDPRSRYEVRTPALAAVVRGTLFTITVAPNGDTDEVTAEGLVAVTAAGAEVLVPPGSTTHSSPGDTPSAPSPVAPGTPLPSPRPTVVRSPRAAAASAASTADPIVPLVPVPTAPVEPTVAPRLTSPSLGSPTPVPSVQITPLITPLPSASLAPVLDVGTSPLTSTSSPLPTGTATPLPSSILPLPSPTLTTTLTPTPATSVP